MDPAKSFALKPNPPVYFAPGDTNVFAAPAEPTLQPDAKQFPANHIRELTPGALVGTYLTSRPNHPILRESSECSW
jgi:hypothetical protein